MVWVVLTRELRVRKSLSREDSQAQGDTVKREGTVRSDGLDLVLPGLDWALTRLGPFDRLCSLWPWKAPTSGRQRQPRLLPNSPSPPTQR